MYLILLTWSADQCNVSLCNVINTFLLIWCVSVCICCYVNIKAFFSLCAVMFEICVLLCCLSLCSMVRMMHKHRATWEGVVFLLIRSYQLNEAKGRGVGMGGVHSRHNQVEEAVCCNFFNYKCLYVLKSYHWAGRVRVPKGSSATVRKANIHILAILRLL